LICCQDGIRTSPCSPHPQAPVNTSPDVLVYLMWHAVVALCSMSPTAPSTPCLSNCCRRRATLARITAPGREPRMAKQDTTKLRSGSTEELALVVRAESMADREGPRETRRHTRHETSSARRATSISRHFGQQKHDQATWSRSEIVHTAAAETGCASSASKSWRRLIITGATLSMSTTHPEGTSEPSFAVSVHPTPRRF